MKIHILDPTLEAGIGHHHHFAVNALRELRARGDEVRIYGRQRARATPELPVRPLFRHSHYDSIAPDASDPYAGMLSDVNEGARLFAQELSSIGADAPGDSDLVIVPTAGPRELLGLAVWSQRSSRRPRVFALFHQIFPPCADLSPGTLAGAIYRHVGNRLKPMAERWLIAATSQRLASRIAPPLDCHVDTYPVPIWYPDREPARADTRRSAPVVSFLGDQRPEKGHRLIPTLIRRLRAKGLCADFLVHMGVPYRIGKTEYAALQGEGIARVVSGWVSEEQMLGLFDASSLVALPYDPVRYKESVSGVFATAVARGRPCVVPEDSWMSEQIAAGLAAGVAYRPDGIEAAISEGVGRIDELLARARELAPAWRMHQSGSRLLQRMLAWAGPR